jgi:cysteinyl-tRNA synthetase
MNLHIYNTLTNKKEQFLPHTKNKVSMYVCGPTVYSAPHIGNARAALVGDLFYRLLQKLYEEVTYIRNLTDVDDKIILESEKTGIPINVITKNVTEMYQNEMSKLNMLEPTFEPKVTDNINNIISTIEKILNNKSAYVSENHVVFDMDSFEDYGSLSKKVSDDLIDGARVKPESYKKNPKDFVLWKPSKNENCGWDSPWGYGRPGWHIECTSMIKSIIGNEQTLDIHGGGNDLIFPHHENEIAQGTSCASAKYCNYWFHNGIVLVDKKKMSKSLGNVILVSDIINSINPIVIRLALMSSHYRQPLNWTNDTVNNAKNIYEKIVTSLDADTSDLRENDNDFLELLCDDLNTPNAIQYLVKQAKDSKNNKNLLPKLRYNCDLIGLKRNASKISVELKNKVEDLISQRETARQNKDYASADQIRNMLASMNVDLKDGPSGVTWKIKD